MLSKNRKWCHDLKIVNGVKGHFIAFPPNRLMNSIKHRHSFKILYIFWQIKELKTDYTHCENVNSAGQSCATFLDNQPVNNTGQTCYCKVTITLEEDFKVGWHSYEGSTRLSQTFINPYMPSVLLWGIIIQTMQTQIRRHRMRRLIRVSTVCLQNILLTVE